MRPYELGQKMQVINYGSHQIQWTFMQWIEWSLASSLLNIQFSSRLIYQLLVDKIISWSQSEWLPFSKAKITDAIKKHNSLSTPGPNYIFWHYFKILVTDIKYIINFVNIANLCINPGYWPSHFKISTLIIISKSNKPAYNSSKIFCSIVLLNTLEKLIEKAISERLQIHFIVSNYIYPNQLGGIKQHSTSNTDLYLTHLIYVG